MIIIKLHGGLGNQMFEYALGRSLSLKNETGLLLDTQDYSANTFRSYGLEAFNIQARVAAQEEIEALKPRGIQKLANAFKSIDKRSFIKEAGYAFQPEVLNAGHSVYLETSVRGGWQNLKYFRDIVEVLQKDFVLKDQTDPKLQELLTRIKNGNSASLHIRRSDYLTPKHQNIYNQIGLEYYQAAIAKIRPSELFIFSDDIEWAKANLKTEVPMMYVSDKGLTPQQELFLMSQCKHNITANSTFSWWGAWLNENPGKIVVTPRNWFATETMSEDDLIPPTWIKL